MLYDVTKKILYSCTNNANHFVANRRLKIVSSMILHQPVDAAPPYYSSSRSESLLILVT